jgi:RNA polymerase sigma factor (sigma-70 family)
MVIGPDFSSVLAAAKAGAEWAWAVLYRDLAGAVRGYFRARGATEPEDLASETFLQVARDILSFKGDEKGFRSWVFVIAHRRLMDSWRTAGKRPRLAELVEPVPDFEGGNTEDEALERISSAEVLSALGRLTEDQRAVIALRIIGGLSAEQTAEVLGRRAGAVRALQHRGLLALQEMMKGPE